MAGQADYLIGEAGRLSHTGSQQMAQVAGARAQAEATLELVAEQRIANLIAERNFRASTGRPHGDIDDLILERLGLA